MKRSRHNLSHDHKLSCDMGQLIPVCTEEVLPGDTFKHSTSLLARVAPQVKPVMHDVDIRVHHWYVPNRILWDGWEDFITGEDDVTAKPSITLGATTDLIDHMGMYPGSGLDMDALPVRAYNHIWNEFYRDQDLAAARGVDDLDIARIAWGKDYFTTARATPQQGTAIDIGFSASTAPVLGIGILDTPSASADIGTANSSNSTEEDMSGGGWQVGDGQNSVNAGKTLIKILEGATGYPDIRADLSNATGGINIDDLRQSIALQRIAEARSRFGARYVDYLKFLGVNPKDGRLSRPEYLGGGNQSINFSEVIQTAEGTATDIGDLYGHGIASMRSKSYQKMFEEHGWVMTLLSVRPKTSYLQAIPRKFTRVAATDYWHRELENLPWQTVYETEVYAPGTASTVFGYVPRYDEYRQNFNYASGTFRSTELDWHMSRDLSGAPTLNETFIECTPTDRVYADTSMPEMIINAHNSIQAKRLITDRARLGSL